MKKKKVWLRISMPLLLCLMLVASSFATPAVALGENPATETRDFKVNLFDYDQRTILEILEEEFSETYALESIDAVGGENPEASEVDTEGEEIAISAITQPEYNRMFMFSGGRDDSGNSVGAPANRAWFSKWVNDLYVYQALMNSTLLGNGRAEYTNGILGIDLFNPNEKEKYEAYKNIPFEFNYNPNTGIYSYSSTLNSAYFDGDRVSLDDPLGGGVGVNGFRPFGSTPLSKLDHFGMSMEVEFYIPPGGPDNLIFNFSGDDDVWVFIDNELVLDLGGIHGALGGTITFHNEGVMGTVQSGTKIFQYPDEDTQYDDDYGNIELPGDFSSGTTHTLSFFYLERGGNASNCSIEFNIPPTTADFAFTKADSHTERKLPGAVFRLFGEDSEGREVDRTAESDEDGIVRFEGLPEGEYELTEKEAPEGYKPSDEVYLILVTDHEPLVPVALEAGGDFGLTVWYALKPGEGEDPQWFQFIGGGSLWIGNEKLPPEEKGILTIKKTVTGNRAPADANYEFMIRFYDIEGNDGSTFGIRDNENEIGPIRNLTPIDTEYQEGGDYAGYFRFLLKNGQQISFDYGEYYGKNEVNQVSASLDLPDLLFRLIETKDNGAASVTISAGGQFGTGIPLPLIEGKQVGGALGGDSKDALIAFTNAFGNKDKDKDRKKEDVPEPLEPVVDIPAVEIVQPSPPMPPLPKTGGVGPALFVVLGSLLAGIGAFMRRP